MPFQSIVRLARLLHTPMHKRHHVVLTRHRLVYSRIPKAANSSIKQALARHVDLKSKDAGGSANTDRFWFHRPEYGIDIVGARELVTRYPDYFVFTFVRNPFDRLVSVYHQKIAHRMKLPKGLGPLGFSIGMDFADFIVRVSEIGDDRADRHFRGQLDMLTYRGKYLPDFTGRVESATDWDRLAEILRERDGFEIGPLPRRHVKREDHTDLLDYFTDPAMERLVQDRFAADFEKFYPDASDLATTMALLRVDG